MYLRLMVKLWGGYGDDAYTFRPQDGEVHFLGGDGNDTLYINTQAQNYNYMITAQNNLLTFNPQYDRPYSGVTIGNDVENVGIINTYGDVAQYSMQGLYNMVDYYSYQNTNLGINNGVLGIMQDGILL